MGTRRKPPAIRPPASALWPALHLAQVRDTPLKLRALRGLAADLDRLLSRRLPAVEIVCGGCASGADVLAVRYAHERRLALRVFPAQWRLYGAAAGPFRNAAMAAHGDALVAYWDGCSAGTASMVRCASARGLRVILRRF